MNVEDLKEFVLSLPVVEENQPWAQPRYEMLIMASIIGVVVSRRFGLLGFCRQIGTFFAKKFCQRKNRV